MYQIIVVKGSLWARQQEANHAGCQAYVEQHLNAVTDADVNYAMAIVGDNASGTSIAWAATYTELVSRMFGHPNRGVVRGGRGSYNVEVANCPSILLEPGFISNPSFANWVRTGEGIDGLAKCLADSVKMHFPEPGHGPIGLSVGHAFRGRKDPGAPFFDKGKAETDPQFDDETELNIEIVRSAAEMLCPGFEWLPETLS